MTANKGMEDAEGFAQLLTLFLEKICWWYMYSSPSGQEWRPTQAPEQHRVQDTVHSGGWVCIYPTFPRYPTSAWTRGWRGSKL